MYFRKPLISFCLKQNELELMQRIKHPNLIEYVDHFESKDKLCIVMALCRGDLEGRFKDNKLKKKSRMDEDTVLYWFVQMVLGVQFMHLNDTIHRDIKSQNMFMIGNDRLVLGDLGISRVNLPY